MAKDIIGEIMSRIGNEKAFKFSDLDLFSEQKFWVSTGSPFLDYSLNTHGYPKGIIEVRGASQSGKTTFALEALKACLKIYKERAICVILSSERRDNRSLASAMGLDLDRVLIVPTATIEDVFNNVARVVEHTNEMVKDGRIVGKPRFFFVWDSLGNTVSSQERDAMKIRAEAKKAGDEEKHAAMGSAARAISFGLRGLVGLSDGNEITFFIINRAYSNIGSVGKTSYGGQAVEYYPNMRLELARIQAVKAGEVEVGQLTQVKVIKSDFGLPKQKFVIEIGYGLGMVLTKDDIDFAIKKKILEKFGANGAKFGSKLSWKFKKDFYALYEEQNPLLKVLHSKILKERHKDVLKEHEDKRK